VTVSLHDCFIGRYREGQQFGANKLAYAAYWPGGHEGIDFLTPRGVAAIAATQGLVIHAGQEAAWAAYGNFVEVWDDQQRCATLYGHLREVRVSRGQRVWLGELLGFTDNTGHSFGDHLHFGLCLTDAAGNRLNRGNGTAGWVNPDSPAIAKWIITNPATPAAGPALPPIIPPPPAIEPPPPKIPPVAEVAKLAEAKRLAQQIVNL
jgi:murein DD-endopeptidase MepM/ murein hydrolase activator NlpD